MEVPCLGDGTFGTLVADPRTIGSVRPGEPEVAQTILVVEDETKIRSLLRGYLERAGFSVLTTGSGAEALTLAATAMPDLVLLDLGLPDVPGETVAREIRRASRTPILMLTAKASEEDRIAGLELGADDYVTKPFSPQEVVLRVQAILRRADEVGGRSARAARSATASSRSTRTAMRRSSAADRWSSRRASGRCSSRSPGRRDASTRGPSSSTASADTSSPPSVRSTAT